MKKKKLLIPNGSSSEIMLIKAAQKLGYYVITSGNNSSLIGHKYSDEYVPADFSKPDELLKIAIEQNIDAVCGNANDLGMLSAIYVAEKLGLPGVHDTLETSRIFHEKDLFKQLCSKLNIPTPRSKMFDNVDEAIDYSKKTIYPIMVKPVDLSAGRGCSRADSSINAVDSIRNAFSASKAKRVVIEEYLEGRQYDFHTIIINNKVVWYSPNSEFSYKNPYQVSCLCIPADHSDKITELLISYAEMMAHELNIADGPLWFQYRIKDEVPYLIESARRCGGNNMLDLVSRAYGMDFAEWVVKLETGMSYDLLKEKKELTKPTSYLSLMADKNGTIKGVHIDNELRKHIYLDYYWYEKEQKVTDYLYERWGIILYEYDTYEEIEEVNSKINELAYLLVD